MKQTITHFSSGRARHGRKLSAVLQLLLVALMLIPGSARAEGDDGDEEFTFTYISADPEGNFEYGDDGWGDEDIDEKGYNLFDDDTDTKWCFNFSEGAYVVFQASKPGHVTGYTITTGNDNSSEPGRNPKGWTLYGSNDKESWTVIDQVADDTKLKDEDATDYDYSCTASDKYEYFKWVITQGGSSNVMQASGFKLKMISVLCAEHQIETVAAQDPTCTEEGNLTYYRCTACGLRFKDAQGVEQYKDKSYIIPAKGHQWENLYCTACNACALTYEEDENGKLIVTGFEEGVSITDLVIPAKINEKDVVAIGECAFYETSLASVSIPASVEKIDYQAFEDCYALSAVSFAADAKLKKIYGDAFNSTSLASVSIPASVEEISYNAFAYCRYLSTVTFAADAKLETIGYRAFISTHLAQVSIPASVKNIEGEAFAYTPLVSVNIPAAVENIEEDAFLENAYLETVTFNRSLGDDENLDGYHEKMFRDCYKLKTVYVPWKSKEAYVGKLAQQKGKIKGILTDDTEGIIYEVNDETHELACIGTSHDKWTARQVQEEVEGMPVTEIKENAFKENKTLLAVDVPASVKTVGTQAFAGCEALHKVYLKGNAATIAADAFKNTPQLEAIYVSKDAYANYLEQGFEQSNKLLVLSGSEDIVQLTDEVGLTEEMVSIPTVYAPETLSYQRQLETPGEYATICLPFDICLSSDQGMFEKVYVPLNTMIHNTQKSTPELEHFVLMLEEQKPGNLIPAGQPIFVKMAEDKDVMAFTNNWGDDLLSTGIQPKNEEMKVVDWDGTSGLMKQNLQFHISYHGTFQPKEAQAADHLWTFNPNGTFGKQTEGTVHPFRLVLKVEKENEAEGSGSDGSGSEGSASEDSGSEGSASEGSETENPATQSKQYVFSIGVSDGTATGIREIISSEAITTNNNPNGSSAHTGIVYDLSGRKVSTAAGSQDVKNLRKGIYVVNGKKIVVK